MKKYKIGNRIIEAESAIHALKLHKMIDSTKLNDSVKDEDIDQLSIEEQKAIEDYRKAIQGTTNPKLLELYAHILKEEVEHLEELQNAKNEEFEDSVKDMPLSFVSNVNSSAFKSNVQNYLKDPTNNSSLLSNLDSIQADRKEWRKYQDKGYFEDNQNLKLICKNRAKEYIDLLNKVSDIKGPIQRNINRMILDLSADLINIF